MIEKQTNFFIHLMENSLKKMEDAASNENFTKALKERKNIFDVLTELTDYLISMGYVIDFEFSEKITKEDFRRLKFDVSTLVETQADPIIEFVNKLRNGGGMTSSEDIQFYTNNKSAIEAEMKKDI
jgi:hypothetical protein